jgi:hypothetical protein
VSGTVVSGAVVSGTVVSGAVVSGRVVSGAVVSGRVVSGATVVSGVPPPAGEHAANAPRSMGDTNKSAISLTYFIFFSFD